MAVRGVRGAITIERDDAALILAATERLLREIITANDVAPEDIASAMFTVTPDVSAQFPAAAARAMGWTQVPLLNFTEIGVPGALERCIRVLLHINTEKTAAQVVHVYLEQARSLRSDLQQS
jgi:chorismate mutase